MLCPWCQEESGIAGQEERELLAWLVVGWSPLPRMARDDWGWHETPKITAKTRNLSDISRGFPPFVWGHYCNVPFSLCLSAWGRFWFKISPALIQFYHTHRTAIDLLERALLYLGFFFSCSCKDFRMMQRDPTTAPAIDSQQQQHQEQLMMMPLPPKLGFGPSHPSPNPNPNLILRLWCDNPRNKRAPPGRSGPSRSVVCSTGWMRIICTDV